MYYSLLRNLNSLLNMPGASLTSHKKATENFFPIFKHTQIKFSPYAKAFLLPLPPVPNHNTSQENPSDKSPTKWFLNSLLDHGFTLLLEMDKPDGVCTPSFSCE